MAKNSRSKKQPTRLLSHHRHTGKVLHHRHTSYPIVALLLLMVGVILTQSTLGVQAADVAVTATANGPLPPSAAEILDPEEGDRFSTIPIPISGTCPYPFVVKVYRNNLFSGSTQCNPDGTWLLYSDLFAGENELVARIFNFADQEGPQSAPVTVFYDAPDPPPTPPGQSPSQPSEQPDGGSGTATPAEEVSKPFLITTDIYFKAIYVGDEIQWEFGLEGGDAPFDITVAWGDGGTSTLNSLTKRTFTATHTYTKAPSSREYFPVTVSARDTTDRTATLQVFTILNDRISPAAGGSGGSASGGGGSSPFNLSSFGRIAWPAYAVTVLMVISFWLGKRQGLLVFSRAPKAVKSFHRKHFLKPPRRHA